MSYSWQQYPQQGQAYPQYPPATPTQAQTQTPLMQTGKVENSPSSRASQASQTSYPQQGAQQPYSQYHQGAQPYATQATQGPYQPYSVYQQQSHYQQQTYAPYGPWTAQSSGYLAPQQGYPPQGSYNYPGYGAYPQQVWGPQQPQYPYGVAGPQGYSHQAAYPQNYPQPLPQQRVAKPSLNTCYNCGDPSHWAQDCPEPRRALPHGQSAQQSKPNKLNYVPPVVTKYPVPQHATQGSAGAYGPLSAGPYSSNPGSAQPQYGSQPNWHSSQHSQSAGPSPSTPLNNHQSPNHLNQQSYAVPQTLSAQTTQSRRASIDQSASMGSSSETDTDEDSLSLLDIPDLPQNHGTIIAKPPVLVRHPLPALSESDALGKMLPPISMSDGKVQSKYITGTQDDYIKRGVQDLEFSDERQHDPLITVSEKYDFMQYARAKGYTIDQGIPSREPSLKPAVTYSQNYEKDQEVPSAFVNNWSGLPGLHDLGHGSENPAKRKFSEGLNESDSMQRVVEHPLPQKPSPLSATHSNRRAPLPPPPPPPEGQSSWSHSSHEYSPTREYQPLHSGSHPGSLTLRSSYSNFFGDSASPPGDQSQKKRKLLDSDGRQYDDVTPRLKRNQPKVAAAYCRRW